VLAIIAVTLGCWMFYLLVIDAPYEDMHSTTAAEFAFFSEIASNATRVDTPSSPLSGDDVAKITPSNVTAAVPNAYEGACNTLHDDVGVTSIAISDCFHVTNLNFGDDAGVDTLPPETRSLTTSLLRKYHPVFMFDSDETNYPLCAYQSVAGACSRTAVLNSLCFFC
jgi:hypothetical protein